MRRHPRLTSLEWGFAPWAEPPIRLLQVGAQAAVASCWGRRARRRFGGPFPA